MKKTAFIQAFSCMLLFGSLSLPAMAQRLSYGVHAGVSLSGFHGGKTYIVYDSKAQMGYELGFDLACNFGGNVIAMTGFGLSQQSGRFSAMSPYISSMGNQATEFPSIKTKVLSLEVPLKIGYDIKPAKNFSLVPNAVCCCDSAIE